MYFDFSQLLDWNYYTHMSPQGDFLLGFPLLAFFVALLFIRSIALFLGPNDKYFKKSLKRRTGKFIALGVLGIIAILSRFALIPLFSMRLWLYSLFALSIGFLIATTYSIWSEYEKRLSSVRREYSKKKK